MGNSLIQRTGTSITHTGFHRRTGITLIALTATTAAPALSACSPSSPANEAETASTAQGASVLLPEGEGSTQYPLTLETPFGHTVLDKRPERVAVVSAVGVGTESLLALDAAPVFAVAKYDGEDPWLPNDLWEQVEFTEQGDAGEEISAEAIAASEPETCRPMRPLTKTGSINSAGLRRCFMPMQSKLPGGTCSLTLGKRKICGMPRQA